MICSRLFGYRFKISWKFFRLQILIFLTLSISSSTFASSLEGYCISKTKPQPSQSKAENNSKNEISSEAFPPIIVSKDGEKFIIEEDSRRLQLRRIKDDLVVFQSIYFLEKNEWINSIYLTKDNWLLIHADRNNYITKINPNFAQPRIKTPDKLPKVYREKCSRFDRWFWGGCPVSRLDYSPTLDRVFISGYHSISSGQKWMTMEIVAGKPKILSSPQKIQSLAADIPKFNGVVFRGVSQEVLFYDGVKLIELLTDFSKYRIKGKIPSWRIKGQPIVGYSQDIFNGRIFIATLYTSVIPKFLLELKTEPSLAPISLPEELKKKKNIGLDIGVLPNDSRLWAIMGNNILVEIKGKMQIVATAPKSYLVIRWTQSFLTSAIFFDVVNKNTQLSTTYYIKQASPNAQCEVMLDPNNPVLLTGD